MGFYTYLQQLNGQTLEEVKSLVLNEIENLKKVILIEITSIINNIKKIRFTKPKNIQTEQVLMDALQLN
jgi:hypothetical protein